MPCVCGRADFVAKAVTEQPAVIKAQQACPLSTLQQHYGRPFNGPRGDTSLGRHHLSAHCLLFSRVPTVLDHSVLPRRKRITDQHTALLILQSMLLSRTVHRWGRIAILNAPAQHKGTLDQRTNTLPCLPVLSTVPCSCAGDGQVEFAVCGVDSNLSGVAQDLGCYKAQVGAV